MGRSIFGSRDYSGVIFVERASIALGTDYFTSHPKSRLNSYFKVSMTSPATSGAGRGQMNYGSNKVGP